MKRYIIAIMAMLTVLNAQRVERPFDITKFPIECTGIFGEQRGEFIHAGVDYKLNEDSELTSPCDGTIKKARWFKGYGNAIVIDAGQTNYGGKVFDAEMIVAHMNQIDVQIGDDVKQGQRIGLSGNTGSTKGSHVHYELRLIDTKTGKSFPILPRSI
jgi:murein DD-endopeptidase MepM/ murein hydrolase activator NlpD